MHIVEGFAPCDGLVNVLILNGSLLRCIGRVRFEVVEQGVGLVPTALVDGWRKAVVVSRVERYVVEVRRELLRIVSGRVPIACVGMLQGRT